MSHGENINQNHNKNHFTPTRMAIIKDILRVIKDMEKLEPSYTSGQKVKWYNYFETVALPQKVKPGRVSTWLSNSTSAILCIYPKLNPLLTQQVKDLVMSLPWIWLLLWHRFDPWPRNFCVLACCEQSLHTHTHTHTHTRPHIHTHTLMYTTTCMSLWAIMLVENSQS